MTSSAPSHHGRELTLAEVERETGIAARTVRYYQSEGLLHRPARRAGKAVYGEQHLDRLRAISSLQDQGLRLQTIRQVLGDAAEPANDVVDLLGPAITGTGWLATSARTLDEGELADLLGDNYPDQVPALVSTGYLERRTGPDGRRSWYAPSVPQLRGALELFEIGTDFTLSRWASDTMRDRIRELCELLVARWVAEAGTLYDGEGTSAGLERNLERLRSVAWQTAAHLVAEEIGAAISHADEIRARVEAGEFSAEDLGR
ncbi:helix-turn-helix domain-containing protein [Nocardioides sp. YIM 152588]|uniref:helix-turn-helix domain-containing protein n=1 Tax=Nocardioides sp. YIM 152588 TaxID=3158259 RepID=UPI0032E3E936